VDAHSYECRQCDDILKEQSPSIINWQLLWKDSISQRRHYFGGDGRYDGNGNGVTRLCSDYRLPIPIVPSESQIVRQQRPQTLPAAREKKQSWIVQNASFYENKKRQPTM